MDKVAQFGLAGHSPDSVLVTHEVGRGRSPLLSVAVGVVVEAARAEGTLALSVVEVLAGDGGEVAAVAFGEGLFVAVCVEGREAGEDVGTEGAAQRAAFGNWLGDVHSSSPLPQTGQTKDVFTSHQHSELLPPSSDLMQANGTVLVPLLLLIPPLRMLIPALFPIPAVAHQVKSAYFPLVYSAVRLHLLQQRVQFLVLASGPV